MQVGVEGNELVIRVDLDWLKYAFEVSEENQPYDEKAADFRREWKVTDKARFGHGVALALQAEEEDGSTPLTALLDAAFGIAVENDMGVDEDGRIVTNEMLQFVSPSDGGQR